ncbi:MAG: winged helix-turn-helix domain-containing protein [Hydrogenibacillus schlegelii]|uniref:Winged helix-turn-helix domain-containing protein n=1 Tax=Hydrogenibacillus schlegelii TaxID=1484 RepID=A0A947GC25_HYDSH|nr:winged helix-turn-helix domain-containing protein [Hydrogenibacillus schlegelii]
MARQAVPAVLVVRDVRVDVPGVRVWRGGQPVALSPREFDLLVFLLNNAGRVVSREEILDGVWGKDAFVEPNIVEVYVRYLRQKLERPGEPPPIETIRKKGYVVRP